MIPADRVRNTQEPQRPISRFINPIVFALAAPEFPPHLYWVECIYSWLLEPGRVQATRRRFGAFTKPASQETVTTAAVGFGAAAASLESALKGEGGADRRTAGRQSG